MMNAATEVAAALAPHIEKSYVEGIRFSLLIAENMDRYKWSKEKVLETLREAVDFYDKHGRLMTTDALIEAIDD